MKFWKLKLIDELQYERKCRMEVVCVSTFSLQFSFTYEHLSSGKRLKPTKTLIFAWNNTQFSVQNFVNWRFNHGFIFARPPTRFNALNVKCVNELSFGMMKINFHLESFTLNVANQFAPLEKMNIKLCILTVSICVQWMPYWLIAVTSSSLWHDERFPREVNT